MSNRARRAHTHALRRRLLPSEDTISVTLCLNFPSVRSGVVFRDHLVPIFPGITLLCLKAQPRHLTRTEFASRLVDEAGAGFRVPEAHARQKVA